MTNDKYKSMIGKPSYTLSENNKSKKSGLLKKIVLVTIGTVGIFAVGNKLYQKLETPANMIMEAKEIYNPIQSNKLWQAYMGERELNGFLHNSNSWKAYQEKTKELNGGSLKDIVYTPDANHNGKAN
ncbi:hypothetical protein GW931_00580 [archaeon]|nr:hypothetical protein [archaeon]